MLFTAKQLHDFVEGSSASSVCYGGAIYSQRTKRELCNRVLFGSAGRFEQLHMPLTKKKAQEIMRKARDIIASRNSQQMYDYGLGKFFRPWDVVPSIRDFTAPEGDYGIGVEVEMGFHTEGGARTIANVIKSWKHIALDTEGGSNGIETTFPPVLLSKFDGRSQACRYLDLLNKNQELVIPHSPAATVGTHINVSKGGSSRLTNSELAGRTIDFRHVCMDHLNSNENLKYFGRIPYGYAYHRTKYMEFKLFNSQLDSKRLRQYVNIAVALYDLLDSETAINRSTVIAALETGFNK